MVWGSEAVTGSVAAATEQDRVGGMGNVARVTPSGTDQPDETAPGGAVPGLAPADASVTDATASGFQVRLSNFTGPFDLLLQLIGKQKLEITELSLHKVTDEFIAYIRAMGDNWDLDEVSEFLVVGATLLDLKAARLLPAADVEDDEDLALLEARDLLFARLLQYKAFKEVASFISARDAEFSRGFPRAVALEPRYAEALPDLVLGIGAARLAQLAAKALAPKVPPVVSIDHVHLVRVSVREHALILRDKLLRLRVATFRALCGDCHNTLEVVARFLALLELYREGLVAFDQVVALGELTVRWTGDDAAGVGLAIDEYGDEAPKDDDTQDDDTQDDDTQEEVEEPTARPADGDAAHGGEETGG